jgi:hypothetical protein
MITEGNPMIFLQLIDCKGHQTQQFVRRVKALTVGSSHVIPVLFFQSYTNNQNAEEPKSLFLSIKYTFVPSALGRHVSFTKPVGSDTDLERHAFAKGRSTQGELTGDLWKKETQYLGCLVSRGLRTCLDGRDIVTICSFLVEVVSSELRVLKKQRTSSGHERPHRER